MWGRECLEHTGHQAEGHMDRRVSGFECPRLVWESVAGVGRDFRRAGNSQGGTTMLGTGGGSWLVDSLRISSPAFSHCLPCCTQTETKSQLRSGPRNPPSPIEKVSQLRSGPRNPCALLEATMSLCAPNSTRNTLGPFSSLRPCLG